MAELLRHRQTKEAETDMFSLKPPRHISTLPNSGAKADIAGGPESGQDQTPRGASTIAQALPSRRVMCEKRREPLSAGPVSLEKSGSIARRICILCLRLMSAPLALLMPAHTVIHHGPVQSNGMCLLEFVVHWKL